MRSSDPDHDHIQHHGWIDMQADATTLLHLLSRLINTMNFVLPFAWSPPTDLEDAEAEATTTSASVLSCWCSAVFSLLLEEGCCSVVAPSLFPFLSPFLSKTISTEPSSETSASTSQPSSSFGGPFTYDVRKIIRDSPLTKTGT